MRLTQLPILVHMGMNFSRRSSHWQRNLERASLCKHTHKQASSRRVEAPTVSSLCIINKASAACWELCVPIPGCRLVQSY